MAEPNLASAQFGGFWIRFLAFIADTAIVCLVMVVILGGAATALGTESLDAAVWLAWLFSFLYWPLMHASRLQATFGKALLGLRVTGYQGDRISILRALGRELAKIISWMVLMVGFIMAAFTGRKQALHDLIASTYVVREGKARVVGALATAVAGFALPVVLLPMMAGGALMGAMSQMAATSMGATPPPPPPAAQKVVAKAAAPKPEPAAPAAVAPVPVPAPVPVAAPAPVPVAVAALPEPLPWMAEPKAAPKRGAAKAKPAARAASFEPKAVAARASVTPGPRFNDLMTAVLYKDAEGINELLKMGKWPDKPDSRGTTPLMTAVELGDAASAEALLRGGADPARAVPIAEENRDGAMLSLLKRYTR
jgi:uncharacterized RDD family membrane protein YckC